MAGSSVLERLGTPGVSGWVSQMPRLAEIASRDAISSVCQERSSVQVNPKAPTARPRSTMGALPVAVLLGQSAAAEEDLDARAEVHHHHHDHDEDDDDDHDEDDDHHHDHGHDDFETFVVTRGEIADPVAFARFFGPASPPEAAAFLRGDNPWL